MFDTMVFTKALGALCGALLIFLLGSWVASSLYVPGSRNLPAAFVVDTGDAAEEEVAADAAPARELTLEEAFAMADAAAGARVWTQCRACHVVDDTRNGVGPYLQNVVSRPIGAVDGFRYSGALPEGERWTVENLYAFLENPRGWAPGTSMAFNGLRSQSDRVNLIAYLIENSPDHDPADLPAAPAEEGAAAAEDATEEDAAAALADEAARDEETAAAPAEEAVREEEVAAAPAEDAAPEEDAAAAPAEEAAPEEEVAAAPAEEAPVDEDTAAAAPEEVIEDETAAEAPDGDVSPFAQMVADGDPAAGARVWNQCRACHVADATTNRVGPHLVGIIGRPSNSVDGFRYSGRLPDVVWTLDELNAFLENPRGYAAGTSMAFNGLRNEVDRANLLAYLQSLN